MTGKVKQLKAEGKPMPKDFQQLEREFGEDIKPWQSVCMNQESSRQQCTSWQPVNFFSSSPLNSYDRMHGRAASIGGSIVLQLL